MELLLRWNERINLTAVREPDEIELKHFADSRAVLPHIPTAARTLVDVGSGAGFPGAVIALERPDLLVTLVESSHKKAAFLQALRREIPLSNLTVLAERIEQVVKARGFTPFDVAISRATWALPEWLQRGRALVKPGGTVLAMEGAEEHPLPPGATRRPYRLGNAQRAIVVWMP
jgi:16S rRNA (guanine527-N7)-methyltransferase